MARFDLFSNISKETTLQEKYLCFLSSVEMGNLQFGKERASRMVKIRLRYSFYTHYYLLDHKFQVKIKNHCSNDYLRIAGLPQGSSSSPVLFLHFTSNTLNFSFSDDTAILATKHDTEYAIVDITRHVKILSDQFLNWKIAVNIDKGNVIVLQKMLKNTYAIPQPYCYYNFPSYIFWFLVFFIAPPHICLQYAIAPLKSWIIHIQMNRIIQLRYAKQNVSNVAVYYII